MTRQRNSGSIDPREMPAYTVPEAAHYLGLPVSTSSLLVSRAG
ncbi:MAG: hypothetical protein V3S33_06435 [Gammaproteobacteria bacterium]